MHRIDTKTAQKDKFGAGKNGFTRGNPQTGTPATDLDDDYFDMLQEELCSVVEASGASLEKGRHDQLLTALRALLLSRKNPFGDIKSDGTVKTALENLGLGDLPDFGTAASKDVGVGTGQIPDMSSWTSGGNATAGWRKSPDGFIEQWGRLSVSGADLVVTLPIPFPNGVYTVIATADPAYSNGIEVAQAWPLNNTTFNISCGWILAGNIGPASNMDTLWRAWGK
ncbi:TPA: gp53-like domain-containing protein [Escherichia coli]|uniref:gp53-like domain-containing protein n=1 Tax=Escherichia coli TaxID=562 RepID=UPI0019916C14|nr:tail fiber protein [Escherichia coli]CAD5844679.1 tail fiber protein [Escherichia coli]